MSELAEAITADQSIVHLDEPLATSERFYRLGTELVEVTGRRIREGYDRQAPSGRIVNILRGQGNTTPQAHDAGVALEPYVPAFNVESPFIEPGGGLTASDGSSVIGTVTTLYISDSEPTDQGDPGNLWLQTDPNDLAGRLQLWVWTGSFWERAGVGDALADGETRLDAFDASGNQISHMSLWVDVELRSWSGGVLVQGDTYVALSAPTVVISGIPTSDPGVANQLWNDNGTLKISAG